MSAAQSVRDRLPAIRAELGLSAQQLADLTNGKWTRAQIANLETGRMHRLDTDQLLALCLALGVWINDLVPEAARVIPAGEDVVALQAQLRAIGRLAA